MGSRYAERGKGSEGPLFPPYLNLDCPLDVSISAHVNGSLTGLCVRALWLLRRRTPRPRRRRTAVLHTSSGRHSHGIELCHQQPWQTAVQRPVPKAAEPAGPTLKELCGCVSEEQQDFLATVCCALCLSSGGFLLHVCGWMFQASCSLLASPPFPSLSS